jgi:aarF domain-containing kinase
MLVYRGVLHAFELLFALPLSWSAEYTEEHLRQEVDFIREASNSERASKAFEADRNLVSFVYVPEVYWDLTTSRVMTTTWVDGLPLTDADQLKAAGFSLADVTKKMIDIFSFQIFISRFVHGKSDCASYIVFLTLLADPHPGNILVRKHPVTGTTQLCVLDHGLYVEESESFRYEYCVSHQFLILL